jgi:hypothetical protein
VTGKERDLTAHGDAASVGALPCSLSMSPI